MHMFPTVNMTKNELACVGRESGKPGIIPLVGGTQPVERLPIVLPSGDSGVVPVPIKRNVQGYDVFRPESEVSTEQFEKAAAHAQRTRQKDHGERGLDGDERDAHPARA